MTEPARKKWSLWSSVMVVVLAAVVGIAYQIVRDLDPELPPDPPRFIMEKTKQAEEHGKVLPEPVIHAGESRMRWPTAKETNILWNIDRDRFIADKKEDLTEFQKITGEAVLPATFHFARSVVAPSAGAYETPDVIQDGLMAVRHYLDQHMVSRVSDQWTFLFAEKEFFGYLGKTDELDYAEDRTLTVFVTAPSLFTPDFVRMLQKGPLKKWSEWRIFLIADEHAGEDHLLIYPDRIFVGAAEHLASTMDQPIQAWQTALEQRREPKAGPQRRQFQHVRRILPEAIAKLKTEPVVLLATFDSCCGDFDDHSMWFLSRRTDSLDITSPRVYSHGHAFIYVTENGEVAPSEDPAGVFELEEIGLSRADIPNVTLTYGRMKQPWKSPATLESIIKDADLMRDDKHEAGR